MYDYDPQKVSMSKLRLAYALNDHEVAIVMDALWPHALFPLELWRKTHEQFWRGFANSVTLLYSIESPEFPESNDTDEKYFYPHLYAQDMENLFSKLASRIHVNALREGLRYILSITYGNGDEIPFQEKMDILFEKLSMVEENNGYRFIQRQTHEKFVTLMEEKIFCIPPSGYFFVSKIYPDTILVDTVSAIRHLHFLNIPFKNEVKGITRALVDSVINALTGEVASTIISTPQPQEQPKTPASTGSKQDVERINATRKVCEDLVEELLQERQSFENNKDTWERKLLYDNGKTLNKTFLSAAEARLGTKPHGATAKEVWEKVPDKLKHMGRMREQ